MGAQTFKDEDSTTKLEKEHSEAVGDSGESKPKEEFQEGISTHLDPLHKRTEV